MTPLAAAPPPPAPLPLISAAEFMARYENVRAELVKGIVKELPMPETEHGKICITIGALIYNYAKAHDVGHVMGNDTWIRTGIDTIRGGDVLFVNYERLPRGKVTPGILSIAPDLVVEVRSPSDRWTEMFTKVIEYLKAGVRVVVVLDPKSETASVYRDDEFQQIFHNGDPLTIPDVLPGFSVAVNELFM